MSNNYLTLDDELGIHEDSVEAFGGSHGIRDRGGLESAVMRPQSGYYPDVIAEAAALWESLSQNHPFIDGNKRTAIASMAAHLFMNGIWLEAEQLETQDGFGGPNWKRGCGHTLSPGCDHRESRATSDHMPFTNFWS